MDEYGQDYKKVAAEFIMKDKTLPSLDVEDGESMLDVQAVNVSLFYSAKEMVVSNDADTIIEACSAQSYDIADTICG